MRLTRLGRPPTPGLFGAVGRAAKLLAAERAPLGEVGDRPGKRRRRDDHHNRPEQSNVPSVAHGARPVAAGVAGGAILGLSIPVAAALAGMAVIAVVGGWVVLGGGLGGGGASPVAVASAGPSLASLPPASIMAIASASPIVSASASTAPQDFAGIFNVTWIVVGAETAPGYQIGYPKGSTGTTRVKVTTHIGSPRRYRLWWADAAHTVGVILSF